MKYYTDEYEKFNKKRALKSSRKWTIGYLVASYVSLTCWIYCIIAEVIFPKSTMMLIIYCALALLMIFCAVIHTKSLKKLNKEILEIM